MIFLLRYWQSVVAAIALIVVYGTGYLNGMHGIEREWDKARTAQLENNLKINAEVSNDYAKKMADLRKRYDALSLRPEGSLRIPNCTSGTSTTSGTDTLHGELSTPWLLMYQADTQTQQLISLQDWVRNVSK